MKTLDLIGFDADDTLWHTESLYRAAQDRLAGILAGFAPAETVQQTLDSIEAVNIRQFGYGIKSFVLSMIETAVRVSDERATGREIGDILAMGKEMLLHEIQPLEGVEGTLADLAGQYPLMVITKGDLLDQEEKLKRSGLAEYFRYIEIVSEKDPAAYQKILDRYGIAPERFLMVGNSLKSDILPVVQIGASAVYIPYEITWVHETQPGSELAQHHYEQLDRFNQLPGMVRENFAPAAPDR